MWLWISVSCLTDVDITISSRCNTQRSFETLTLLNLVQLNLLAFSFSKKCNTDANYSTWCRRNSRSLLELYVRLSQRKIVRLFNSSIITAILLLVVTRRIGLTYFSPRLTFWRRRISTHLYNWYVLSLILRHDSYISMLCTTLYIGYNLLVLLEGIGVSSQKFYLRTKEIYFIIRGFLLRNIILGIPRN